MSATGPPLLMAFWVALWLVVDGLVGLPTAAIVVGLPVAYVFGFAVDDRMGWSQGGAF